jgi:hypothetical protein
MLDNLPLEITGTGIWRRTLAFQEGDIHASSKEKLIIVFKNFRERAKIISEEISRNFPELTVHDITHIDALWELADSIIGPEYPLTPAEVFVLGGVFLMHDLGMALSAYPGGMKALYETDIWNETISYYLKEKLGRLPTKEEADNPGIEVKDKAIKDILREGHAEIAERMAVCEWSDISPESTKYYLIEDPEIRKEYGSIIGKLAHSHWWSIEKLSKPFIKSGASAFFPKEWTVDQLKIACILRVADACHLNSSRAPGFLKALRNPSKDSRKHWDFQEKLTKPIVKSNRFLFTSSSSFSVDKFDSWWLCYDKLREADQELREVDTLLADKEEIDRPRFIVRSVVGIEDPDRLARLIQTDGWVPVDASIKVSNVSSLVYNLGGKQLYGKDDTIPLRELIQNSIDAIKARRILEYLPDDWGDITVRAGENSGVYWIEVEDNGIGMSTDVLKGPFLDFGNSYWGSHLMRKEHSSLLGRGFQSIGKYGIGFFSVFMWGDKVQVITRCYEDAQKDTHVLEFYCGTNSRPILREAQRNEYLKIGGTRIRVWMKNKPQFNIPTGNSKQETSLYRICSYIAPSIEVNLNVQENDDAEQTNVIKASDWISLDGKELINRISIYFENRHTDYNNSLLSISNNIKPLINDENQTVARACIIKDLFLDRGLGGIVTVGGLYSCLMSGVCGIFTGKSSTASRKISEPIAGSQELYRWATEQSDLITKLYSEEGDLVSCAIFIRAFGGSIKDLPIAYIDGKWKNAEEILRWAKAYDEIIIFDMAFIDRKEKYKNLKLYKNVLDAYSYIPGILQSGSDGYFSWPGFTMKHNGEIWFYERTLQGAVMETIAKAWSVSLSDLLLSSVFYDENNQQIKEIGCSDGKQVSRQVNVMINPKK